MEQVKIEKLVFGGQGLGRIGKKVVFVWNALPGEEANIVVYKKKKNYLEGIAKEIVVRARERTEPREDHYMSCSPWQILSWNEENRWKLSIANETYAAIGKMDTTGSLSIVADENRQYGYRNKMEFSFTKDGSGRLTTALFRRGSYSSHVPAPSCALAEPVINDIAKDMVAWLNAEKIPLDMLKTLLIRTDGNGKSVAGLFIITPYAFAAYPRITETLAGFHVYISDRRTPASTIAGILHTDGVNTLQASIRSKVIRYDYRSFFQVNVPMFEHTLNDMERFVFQGESIVDLYSGAGSISIPLAGNETKTVLVDSDESAIRNALWNIDANKLGACTAYARRAEQALELIAHDSVLICDPPRTGLHDDVIRTIIEVKPRRIMYVSCNVATHARDLNKLMPHYRVIAHTLYNFFPRTPHIESLAVLEKRRD